MIFKVIKIITNELADLRYDFNSTIDFSERPKNMSNSELMTNNEGPDMRDHVKFADDQDRPLIEKATHITLNDEKPEKKPLKIQYYKDKKSLQFQFDFSKDESKDYGMFSQVKHLAFYQACAAEILATFFLVLLAVGSGMNSHALDVTKSFSGSLSAGFIVATMLWIFTSISGCHMNPAVSIGFLLLGKTDVVRFLFFIPCQLFGSCLAIKALQGLVINPALIKQEVNGTIPPPELGLTLLNENISVIAGVGIEILITFVLMITISACVDKDRKDLGGSYPLSIGLAVFCGALFAGPYTGGSMNPARSFGPAFMAGNFENHFTVYWVGPMLGGALAPIIYKLLTFKTTVKVD